MISHQVRVHRSDEPLAQADQLAFRIAEVAADPIAVDDDVVDMVINRIIDDTAVAVAALTRRPVRTARDQAVAHRAEPGATVLGLAPEIRCAPEWAAWANSVSVRELDFHDTFLAAEYAHPGDNIPPLIAVAQHVARSRGLCGRDLVRAIATAYEIQIDLARAISLHQHQIDHVAHLGPSVAAGLGTLLTLEPGVVAQAVAQALHTTTATRQSRKGAISTWKAYAPAFAGKVAIEAIDRSMRGETSPAPIYEGEDGVLARLLDGPGVTYVVTLPGPGEAKRSILESFTKEYSAEYQAQAWIDLARRLGQRYPEVRDPRAVAEIVLATSHHTHVVIGSGSKDPQKYDPLASRETLDHSLPYIFAVALQDGAWHHDDSYVRERATRPDTVELWGKIRTVEDPEWTRRYHAERPSERAFGGRLELRLSDGSRVVEEIAVADAHPNGTRPFAREHYVNKLRTLANGVLSDREVQRFLDLTENVVTLPGERLGELTVRATEDLLAGPTREGIF